MSYTKRINRLNSMLGYVKPTQEELKLICPSCGHKSIDKQSLEIHREDCFDY